MNSKLKYLVVDTGAFIQKQPLWNHAEELYSVPEVLSEIKDAQTHQFIDSFPLRVNFCQPQPSSLKFVTDFSKKSGDFHVLSVTDLKLLALTYELEVKENGSSHLRQEPLKKITNTTVTVPISVLNGSTENKDNSNENNALEDIKEHDENEKMEEDNKAEADGEDGDDAGNESDGWTTISKKKKKKKKFTPPLSENISDTASVTSSVREKLDATCASLLEILESHFTKFSYVGGHSISPLQETIVYIIVRYAVAHLTRSTENTGNQHYMMSPTDEFPVSRMLEALSLLNYASSPDLISSWLAFFGDSKLKNFPSEINERQLLEEYPNIRRWSKHISTYPWLQDSSVAQNYDGIISQNATVKELLSSLLLVAEQFFIMKNGDGEKNFVMECKDDDEEGWITPDNVDQMTSDGWFPVEASATQDDEHEEEDEEDEERPVTVACITVDYTMQNVLKHIKLGVLGIDGRLIRHLRNFALRCFTCFTVTPDMSLLFCPKCGHKTLKRVSVSTNADGTQNIWISRRPLNTRGFRYNLPKPRGGQHAIMPLLTADQRFPHQWAKKAKGVNALDPDYVAGSSPFSARDVNSRAAQHGYYPGSSSGGNAHPTLKYAKIWKPKRKKTVRK